MKPTRISGFAILACALLITGCDLLTTVNQVRRIGVLGFPDNVNIEMPDTVASGEEFTVHVRTLGPNTCWSGDGTEVGQEGLTALIVPYDLELRESGTACEAEVVHIIHTATLQFDLTGTADVDIQGIDGTAERTVVVQ